MMDQGSSIERALGLAIEHGSDAIVVTDADGVIRFVNRAFEKISGYSADEALGKTPAILKSGAHEPEYYGALWATLLAGETWCGEFCNRHKDGNLYREAATISPVRDADGTTTGYVAVKRDLTRELTLEAQLVGAQRLDSIGRLVGGVAHDFNNILTVMLTYLQFLQEDLPADAPMQDDVTMVSDAARRASSLVSQLLAFSNRQAAEPRMMDLNHSLREVEKMLRRIVGEDVTLEVELADEVEPIFADPAHVEQVVINLAVNAREAMAKGGTLTVRSECLTAGASPLSGKAVALRVLDTGEGMDDETRKLAQEPFFTTKNRPAGVGLGLPTVRDIVRRCRGTVEIDSQHGRGTSVSVYFPAATAISAPPANESGDQRDALHLLLVDDDEPVRIAMRRALCAAGYQVTEAQNGLEALEALRATPSRYALVVSDVVMPGLSGAALREQMAANFPLIPVLLVSGYHADALSEHGAVGDDLTILPKPFSVPQLLRAISALLER